MASEQAEHLMQLSATYATGAAEWFCPTCGRRFVMQWPPAYKKIVLDQASRASVLTMRFAVAARV